MLSDRKLAEFVERVMTTRVIVQADVDDLARNVLVDGITVREQADVLIALDRAVKTAVPAWADYLVATLVDYAVWAARPTGYVTAETAHWLVTSLTCGGGPTATAMRAAFEIVREAHLVDEMLLAFVMRSGRSGGYRSTPAPMAA
jgi:hypothetical protein